MISFSDLYHITISSGIHAIFFIIFISILYFTLILRLKKDIFVKFIVDGAKEYSLDKVKINDMNGYKLIMDNLKSKVNEERKLLKEQNQHLIYKTIKIIILLIISFILYIKIISMVLNIKKNNIHLDYYRLMKEILGIIIVVGIYKYLFVKYIMMEYIYYDFNEILYEYIFNNINNIKKYLPTILTYLIIS